MSLDLAGVNVIDAGQAVPNTAILTDGTLTGDGVFDILMRTTKLHLMEEYDAGRITGVEYTTVYLGALNAVLAQAIKYISDHQQTTRTTAEIGLIRQQTVSELAKTDDTIPVGLGFNATSAIKGLVAEEKLLNAQKILLATTQVTVEEKNLVLTDQKIVTELSKTGDVIPVGYGLNTSSAIEGITGAERSKLSAETELTKQKVITELAGTSDSVITGYAKNTSATIGGIAKETLEKSAAERNRIAAEIELTKQKVMTELAGTSDTILSGYAKNTSTVIGGALKEAIAKSGAEVQLLKQKVVTELAQTDNTIPAGTGVSMNTAVTGVVGKQKELFTAQTNGFARDAEQKLTKLLIDPLIAQIAGDSGTLIPTGLANASLDAVITKAKTGIGV